MHPNDQDFFSYVPQFGNWVTEFKHHFTIVGCSAKIDQSKMTNEQMQTDKPVYLGIMAHRQQLQPILDNPHLFDPALVNAVRVLVMQYDDLQILNE